RPRSTRRDDRPDRGRVAGCGRARLPRRAGVLRAPVPPRARRPPLRGADDLARPLARPSDRDRGGHGLRSRDLLPGDRRRVGGADRGGARRDRDRLSRDHQVPGGRAARLRQDVRARRRSARSRRNAGLMGRVEGRVVVVTGGAGGIGAAACRAIASEGGKVLVADLDADAARRVAEAIAADGGEAESIGVDVTDRAQVQAMIRKAVDAFGELNVIFNNAGMNRPRGFMEVDEENFQQIVRVNTWGVIVCTQEAAKQMIAQGSGGKIVNTGAIASRQGFWDFVPYCVAKFGTLAVTQATARGLIEHGITVNA